MSQSARYVLCPYCGRMQPGPDAERCDECGGYFEPLSRRATQIAMGPWYIRDKRVPFRPGCSYEVLVSQIKAGRIKPNTVIRGPTTRQFWSVARNVPGVAHLLGYCHRCGAHVSPNDKACPDCAEPFMAVTERNELGLLYPTAKEAAAAQRALQREVSGEEPEPAAAGTGAEQPASPGDEATGGDLVEQVLGLRATGSPGQQAAPSTAAPPRQGPAPGQVGQLAATGIASGGGPQGAGSSILDFRQGGGAATAGGGGGGSGRQLPGAGHGLDFAPSDAEEEQTAPSGQSAATWILALINVLALIAVLVLVILFLRGQQGDEATQAEAPQGSGIAYNTNTDQDRGEEAEDDPAERRGAPSPAQEQSQAAERTTEPAPDAGPSDGQGTEADTHDSASDEFAPQPPPAPQAPATPQVPVDPPSSPAPESPTPAGDDLFGDSHDRTEAPGEAESPSRQPPRQQAPNNTPTFFGVPLDGDDQADPGDEDATEPVEDDRSGTSDN